MENYWFVFVMQFIIAVAIFFISAYFSFSFICACRFVPFTLTADKPAKKLSGIIVSAMHVNNVSLAAAVPRIENRLTSNHCGRQDRKLNVE